MTMLGLGLNSVIAEPSAEIPPWTGTGAPGSGETGTGETGTGETGTGETGAGETGAGETGTGETGTGGGTGTAVDALVPPENLYSEAQSNLTVTSHVNLRSNWQVSAGQLVQINGNGSTNDVRLDFNAALTPGHAHAAHWVQSVGTVGRYKPIFGGAGSYQGPTHYADEDLPQLHYLPASDAVAFTRFGFNPLDDNMDAHFSALQVFDLSTTDPTEVACDVILCLGDSNMSNAVSDFVTRGNTETAFDPRIWYMPCLRMSNSFSPTSSVRHVPQPCIEPVQNTGGGKRMSPIMALGGSLVGWSAARGRPLLMLAMGDAGSGLNGSAEWQKGAAVATSGGVMYQEMLDMVTALNALGPAHQIVGAVVSLGANDTTGADYTTTWEPNAAQFVSDIRADLALPNLPIVWLTPGTHFEPEAGETRGARMIAAIERLDQDSGSDVAIPGLRAVRPPDGHALSGASDPHFTAQGMQANGRAMGQALLGLL